MKQRLLLLIAFLAVQGMSYAQDSEYVLRFDEVTENQSVKYDDDATTSIMDGATDYTIEMWVAPNDNTASGEVFLSMRNMFRLTYYTNNRFYFTHKDNSSGTVVNTFYNVTNNALTLNQWNHIAVICNSTDGANGSIKLYVNGVDVTAQAYDAKALVGGDANNDVFVGYGGGNYPNMMAREIRIKKVAVDPATLHVNLNDTNYATDTDTAVLFHFAEGTGTTTLNAASGTNANLGFGGAHYPTWVLLTESLGVAQDKNIDFSVYPNPVSNDNFTLSVKDGNLIHSVVVTDMSGKVVFNQNYDGKQLVNIQKDFVPGFYLVQTITGKGTGTQKILVK